MGFQRQTVGIQRRRDLARSAAKHFVESRQVSPSGLSQGGGQAILALVELSTESSGSRLTRRLIYPLVAPRASIVPHHFPLGIGLRLMLSGLPAAKLRRRGAR